MPTANVRYLEDDDGNIFFPVTHQDAVLDENNISLSTILAGKADILTGTTDYWNNRTGYVPPAGTIVVYNDYKSKEVGGETVYIPGIKIGSGNGYVQDLAFVDDGVADSLVSHINNTSVHIQPGERDFWNNKLNVDDNMEVINEALIFNRL